MLSTKSIISNFIIGGSIAIFTAYYISQFKAYNSSEISGFIYAAPVIIPYMLGMVYIYNGEKELQKFLKGFLLGMCFTFPLIYLMTKVITQFKTMLIFSIFYIVFIVFGYIWYKTKYL
tara:strand:- start:2531 stop:2884 length:354 start_codon:yes stop_codon:yes gene_type:complete